MINRLCIFLIITGIFVFAANAQDKEAESVPQPTLVSAPQPVYPKEAKDAGIGGRVTVRVVVDATGAIVSVDSATGPARLCGLSENDPRVVALRESVVEAIKQAKFDPAIKDGQPVKSIAFVGSTFDPFEGSGDKRIVKSGVLTGRALRLPKPEYPGAARASRASGAVPVRVVVDETGNVFTAEAISGHPLLRASAVNSACGAKFAPTVIDGKTVRITGIITYNFMPR